MQRHVIFYVGTMGIVNYLPRWGLKWSRLPELNRRPSNYESDALPTELSRLFKGNSWASRETALYECAVCSVKQLDRTVVV
jgi:hypothetical protein